MCLLLMLHIYVHIYEMVNEYSWEFFFSFILFLGEDDGYDENIFCFGNKVDYYCYYY